MDAMTLFRLIEQLDLHLCEPRFGCPARAHIIGKFLQRKERRPGKIWVLSALPTLCKDGNSSAFPAPCFLDINGSPFPYSWIDLPPGKDRKTIVWDDSRTFEIAYHVVACDIDDWYSPIIYDPVLFSGPVTLGRLISVFNPAKQPRYAKFVQTEWGVAPKNNWSGLTYAPGYACEHSPFSDDDHAQNELMELKAYSPQGVPYSRHSPYFPSIHRPAE